MVGNLENGKMCLKIQNLINYLCIYFRKYGRICVCVAGFAVVNV